MKNDFTDLLHGERDAAGEPWTIAKLAEGIYASRCHVNRVLLNTTVADRAGYGRQTRPKLVRFFKANFTAWRAMLAVLGWDETGTELRPGMTETRRPGKIPHGTLHVAHRP